MDRYMILLTVMAFGFSPGSSLQSRQREYYYINLQKTWTEAQEYCREKYTDLAKIESWEDVIRLNAPFPYEWAWVGLKDDPKSWKNTIGKDANSWRWSTTGETGKTTYHAWREGEPNYGDAREKCVVMTGGGLWADLDCNKQRGFICFTRKDQNKKAFVYIGDERTWTLALTYCRTTYTDLAMIENKEENSEANKVKPAEAETWIGLFRVPWTWTDGSQTSFERWNPSLQNNYGGNQRCGTENNLHEWADERCTTTRAFVCHQDPKKTVSTLKMRMVADVDLTDPGVHSQVLQQLGSLLTSKGWGSFRLKWKNLPSTTRKEERKAQV